jgi:hypothetical protein
MKAVPVRVLLDTQIYILGYTEFDVSAVEVLKILRGSQDEYIVLLSVELIDQIRRVGRRVGGKDWAGWILNKIWQEYRVELVALPERPQALMESQSFSLPSEDILIFFTGWIGRADLLVSENREFVRAAAIAQKLFDCYSAQEFVDRFR